MIGVFEIAVKTAFLDWEAAVLPLNYARNPYLNNRDQALRQAGRCLEIRAAHQFHLFHVQPPATVL